MRKMILALAALILAAGCAQSPDGTDGVSLRYGFDAGDTFRYGNEFSMEMTADLTGLPEGEAPAGPVEMELDATMVTTYAVDDGPEPGTHAVTFGYEDLTDLSMRVSGDGEELTLTEDDLGDDAAAAPLPADLTFVIDDSGNIVSVAVDGGEVPLPVFGGGMTGLAGFGSDMPFLGPELPDHDVSVGDTWTGGWTREVFPGTEIELTTQNRLVAIETVDGVEAYVIETTSTATPISVDLADLLGGFAGEDLGTPPEGFALEMTVTTAPTRSTVWFDAARGISLRQEFTGSMDLTMAFTAEGETGSVTMHMAMSGTLDLL